MEILKKNGSPLLLDDQWFISKDTECVVIDRNEDLTLSIRNYNGIISKIPISVFEDNHWTYAIPSQILLSEEVYRKYFIDAARGIDTIKRVDKLVKENFQKILENSSVVLAKAEYYLLRIPSIQFGEITLGEFLEGIETGEIPVFNKISEFQNLLLLTINGNPMSGTFSALFWIVDEGRFITMQNCKFPGSWHDYKVTLMKAGEKNSGLSIDFQLEAVLKLISEIESQENGKKEA